MATAGRTPNEPRTYIAPDASGTATGTTGADDIFATGPGQTLIGNGGDDIFHLGTHADARIVENDPRISTVDTWSTSYTLPDGIDNLVGEGDYAHRLAGNSALNFITGGGGSDLIIGGSGDTLIGGGGEDTFVVTNGDAPIMVEDMQAGAGGDVVRLLGTGWTSFDEAKAHMTDLPTQGDSDPSLPPGTLTHSSQLVLPSGERLNFADVSMNDFTAANFAFDNSGPTPSPSPSPTPGEPQPTSIGLKVFVAEDAYKGDAQFTVDVDGHQIAGPTAATAAHSTGGFQEFDYLVNTTTPDAPHEVAIHYVNDAWGGSTAADRNLYVGGIEFGGQHYDGQSAQNDADLGLSGADPNAAEMFVNGTVTFADVTHAPSSSPSPSPGPTPSAAEATPTPDEARGYVAPNPSGTAHGTAGADDIFATADGQTLIGNGGDDVFHVGSHTGLTLQETGPGTSAVSTWSGSYALDDGIDNLSGEGACGHALTGNAGANVITGNSAADTLDGGAGSDLLVGGAGADTFLFRNFTGHDAVADFSRADGDKIALDYGELHIGQIDSFDRLQQLVDQHTIAMTSGPDSLTLAFGSAPGNDDTLVIHGITSLDAHDWTFVS